MIGDNVVLATQIVTPGLDPISVTPERIFETGTASICTWFNGVIPQKPFGSKRAFMINGRLRYFCTVNQASNFVFDVIYLYNPEDNAAPLIMPPSARFFPDTPKSFCRYPAYNAYVRVAIYGTIPRWRMMFYRTGRGYLGTADFQFYYDLIEAVRASKAARDKILVDTKTYAVASTRSVQPLRCGTITCGQMVLLPNI
jgi:hypothetical protein